MFIKIVIIKLRLNKGVTVMSEEKKVVKHEQQKKEKDKKQYKPFWIVMSFIILIVVLLLPAPSSLPIMAKAVLAILALQLLCG